MQWTLQTYETFAESEHVCTTKVLLSVGELNQIKRNILRKRDNVIRYTKTESSLLKCWVMLEARL